MPRRPWRAGGPGNLELWQPASGLCAVTQAWAAGAPTREAAVGTEGEGRRELTVVFKRTQGVEGVNRRAQSRGELGTGISRGCWFGKKTIGLMFRRLGFELFREGLSEDSLGPGDSRTRAGVSDRADGTEEGAASYPESRDAGRVWGPGKTQGATEPACVRETSTREAWGTGGEGRPGLPCLLFPGKGVVTLHSGDS